MTDFREFQQARATAAADVWARPRPWVWLPLRKLLRAFNVWLWVFVFFPTLVAGVFYFGVASDQYMSEAKFIVRTQSHAPASGLGALLQSTGLSRAQDDTFSVHDFMMSRDAVRELEQNDHLRDVLHRPAADFVTRFPGLLTGKSFEALYKRYGNFVDVSYDSTTGLSTLKVKAYTAEDARNIAAALLGYSEKLVNKLNERAENDALATARSEVELAEARVAKVQNELTQYRLREQMIDPKTSSSGYLDTIKQLTADRVKTTTQLSELTRDAPSNPLVPVLRSRLASLEAQIADAESRISGGQDSVVTKMSDYEHLNLERELAEKALDSAFQSLQVARLEAQRQQLYIEHIVQPNLADYPLYPKRVVSFVMVAVTCLIAYSIAWLLVAGVREHAEA